MKILLAVDGSACSMRAVAHLVDVLPSLSAAPDLHLLYVHVPLPVGAAQAHVGHDALQRYYHEESLPHLADAEKCLEAAGASFTRHIHVGDAAEVIAHQAGLLACDWVIMGNQGRSAIADAVLGSVAHRVLRLAPCPVLLVK